MKSDELLSNSRKKPAPELSDEKTTFIHSPNLKYQFLTTCPGSFITQLRSQEINQIISFLQHNSIKSDKEKEQRSQNQILICVGAPGTGKTSVIKQAISQFQNQAKKNKKAGFNVKTIRFAYFNGNSFRKTNQLRSQIQKIKEPQLSVKTLPKSFKTNKSIGNSELNVIFIEQFEKIIQSNNESSLEQFFQFLSPKFVEEKQKKNNKGGQVFQKYILIGTSNTINIQQMISKKIGLGISMKAIIFKQYSIESKIKIFQGRLEQIKQRLSIQLKIPDRLIKFIIMKLTENKKDDTRSLIQVIKLILLMAEQNKKVCEDIENGMNAYFDVTLEMLKQHQKLQGMLINSKVQIIQKLNFKQHLILAIIYREFKINQAIDIMYTVLSQQFKKADQEMGLNNYQDFKIMIEELETYGIIQLRNKSISKSGNKTDKLKSKVSVILKTSLRDIEQALKDKSFLTQYFS